MAPGGAACLSPWGQDQGPRIHWPLELLMLARWVRFKEKDK